MTFPSFSISVLSALLLAGMSYADEVSPPVLTWTDCPAAAKGEPSVDGLECSTAIVPVDYANPSRATFSLALIKAPARDTANRIGTLFFNPGGPGESGTKVLVFALRGFSADVRDRFDVVSWDPRGMGGRTTPVVQCFESEAVETAFMEEHLSLSVPITPDELAADAAARAAFNAACVAQSGELLAHVSTADNARDLDLLRQAVGDAALSYYGASYGTFLGATYVNMFPDQVRAAVLDGAVAPSAWMGGPEENLGLSTFLRAGSDFGLQSTIRAFMDQCGAVAAAACAFSAGSPEATRAKWDNLVERAKAGLVLDGDKIDYRDLFDYMAEALNNVSPAPGYASVPGWAKMAEHFQKAWLAVETPGAPAESAAAAAPEAPALPPAPYATSEGRPLAVICGESPNPDSTAAMTAQAEASFARAGVSPWPFIASCVGWIVKAADPYRGPWDKPTQIPALVIGNTYDPATALASSVRMSQELAGARLLIVNGFGHTALANTSACARDYVTAYLIDGVLPLTGASCTQDRPPFPGD